MRNLPEWGKFEEILRFFKITSNSVVIDVGACIGDFTLPAAETAKRVIAIEPEPNNVAMLCRRLRKNNLTNVIVIKKAAWNSKKAMKLYLNPIDKGGHSLVFDGNKKTIKVQADTLDNILDDLKVKK